jgi:hypothetical protein
MRSKLQSSIAVIGLVSVVFSAVWVGGGLVVPASANGGPNPEIEWEDGNCDLPGNVVGTGSPRAPFVLEDADELAEIGDCISRVFEFTDLVKVSASQLTFTSLDHELGVGHSVSFEALGPDDVLYSRESVRVVSVSDIGFTVEVPTGYVSELPTFDGRGGVVTIERDYYKLGSDIDLSVPAAGFNEISNPTLDWSDDGWTPILGVVQDPVENIQDPVENIDFDGDGHTISGLTISNNISDAGLFGVIRDSNIYDLNLDNVNIDISGAALMSRVGALFGTGRRLNVTNVHVDGTVVGSLYDTGLMAGQIHDSTFSNVSSSGVVRIGNKVGNFDNFGWFIGSTPDSVGGLFGEAYGIIVSDATSDAEVRGYVSGTIGDDPATDAVEEPKNGSVYGREVGGLIGTSEDGHLNGCSATGDVVGGREVGGLIGRVINDEGGIGIDDVFATGDVTVRLNPYSQYSSGAGGLFGYYSVEGALSNSHATGDVSIIVDLEDMQAGSFSEAQNIGGLIGEHDGDGTVTDSYATGNVSVRSVGTCEDCLVEVYRVGGFYGDRAEDGGDARVFASGNVSIDLGLIESTWVEGVGGFAGEFDGGTTVVNAYASGNIAIESIGHLYATDIGGFVGESEEYMSYASVDASGDVEVQNGIQVGGFAGSTDNGTQIVDSSATGFVSTVIGLFDEYDVSAGGFIGAAGGMLELTRSFSTGTVTVENGNDQNHSDQFVGGLIGVASDDDALRITDSYTRSAINYATLCGDGESFVGGLFGFTGTSTVFANRVYVANTVTVDLNDDCEVGNTEIISVDAVLNGSFSSVTGNNFFDSTLLAALSNKANFVAKATADMKTVSTFTNVGWSFAGSNSVWQQNSTENAGYPYLRSREREYGTTAVTTTTTTTPPVTTTTTTPPVTTTTTTPPVTTTTTTPPVVIVTIIQPAETSTPTTSTTTTTMPATTTQNNDVKSCVTQASARISFPDADSRISESASASIVSFVERVKRSGCLRVQLTATYSENLALAVTRNRVMAAALRSEFWRQKHVVRMVFETIKVPRTSRSLRTVMISAQK